MNVYGYLIVAITLFGLHIVNCSENKIVRVRIESCPGCQLNRLTEVKKFIFEDVPKYKNVEFKKIPGAPPEAVFLDEKDNEMERIELRSFNRQECNDLLKKKGFEMSLNNEL